MDDWRVILETEWQKLQDEIASLRKELGLALQDKIQLRKENNILRTLAANGNADCPYCGLPAADMAQCKSGFPGCARADDMLAIEDELR